MGAVVEFVGGIVEGAVELVTGIGEDVVDLFVGGSSSYTPGPSKTEAHAKKIADELAEMKEINRKKSEEMEQTLLDYVNREMDQFLEEVEKINHTQYGGMALYINIDGIKKSRDALNNQVKGYIGNILDERLVETDPDLSVILGEENDEKRKEDFSKFVTGIQTKALQGLYGRIEETVNEQSALVNKEIQNRLDEAQQNMGEMEQAYTEILAQKKSDEAQLEKNQIQYMYRCELYSLLLRQIEG